MITKRKKIVVIVFLVLCVVGTLPISIPLAMALSRLPMFIVHFVSSMYVVSLSKGGWGLIIFSLFSLLVAIIIMGYVFVPFYCFISKGWKDKKIS